MFVCTSNLIISHENCQTKGWKCENGTQAQKNQCNVCPLRRCELLLPCLVVILFNMTTSTPGARKFGMLMRLEHCTCSPALAAQVRLGAVSWERRHPRATRTHHQLRLWTRRIIVEHGAHERFLVAKCGRQEVGGLRHFLGDDGQEFVVHRMHCGPILIVRFSGIQQFLSLTVPESKKMDDEWNVSQGPV